MICPTIHPITPSSVSQCSLPAPASAQGQHHETLNRQNGGSAGIKIWGTIKHFTSILPFEFSCKIKFLVWKCLKENYFPFYQKHISFPFPFLSWVFQFPIGWLQTGSEFCKLLGWVVIVFSTPPLMCEGGVGDKGTSCRPLSKLISPGIQNSHSHQNILFTFEQRKYLVHNK